MPGHERRRTRPPEHKNLAVKKGYAQNPLAAAKARTAAAEAAEPKKVKKTGDPALFTDVAGPAGVIEPVDRSPGDRSPGDRSPGDKNPGDKSTDVKKPKVSGPQRDSTGQLYITLAQVLKKNSLASTGGAAKHTVRAGGITVNGTPEDRPGRKLHAGDVIILGDQTITVDLMP